MWLVGLDVPGAHPHGAFEIRAASSAQSALGECRQEYSDAGQDELGAATQEECATGPCPCSMPMVHPQHSVSLLKHKEAVLWTVQPN